jgi:clan AA aspartic protease
MGLVHTEITLKNAVDAGTARRGIIGEKEIRTVTVQALVDTGAGTLGISEEIREKLGLAIQGLRSAELADGGRQVCRLTEPVEVHWNDRISTCMALVIPGAKDVLLGAIPLEDMDLIVHPARNELVGAHGDEIVCMIK